MLSWLAKKVLGGAADATRSPSASGAGGGIGDILEQVLGGATKGTQSGGVDTGSIITDVLGGLLGGGRRCPALPSAPPCPTAPGLPSLLEVELPDIR